MRNDLAGDMFITPDTAENLYNPLRFGKISFLAGGHPARYCLWRNG
ncbi:MAG: hypothetical protein IJP89_01735 [Synergistaceae bacterium]|nr:hypothetical protein [Synergistaceae bacterium]